MPEVELKLQVPRASLAAVTRDLQRGRTLRVRLRALYVDTPDRRLAQAGLALRLRQEGRRWVQAVKGGGEGAIARLEHEARLPPSAQAPAIDVSRHAGTAEGRALAAALDGHERELAPRFETDIRRTWRELRRGGARIEWSLDQGRLVAGEATLPVCEIELELLGGPIRPMTELAAQLIERHGLWLDVRSKAERGQLLADGRVVSPALKSITPALPASASPDAALRLCLRAALQQVLANGASLAAGGGEPEHVHQARVGLRRVMSLLREFGDWSDEVDPDWLAAAKRIFDRLAAARDRDALSAWLWPALREAGVELPPIEAEAPAAGAQDPGAVFRDADTHRSLLEMIAFAHGDAVESAAGTDLRGRARQPLARLHRQLRRAGKDFDALPEEARHRARKRLKRLRYGADSLAMLWPPKAWARYVERLREGQEALGQLQDIAVADALLRDWQSRDPRAGPALAALRRLHERLVAEGARALRGLGKLPAFLR